jgi:hypothetical protein
MTRDDDEAPDPRHERRGVSAFALAVGGLAALLVVVLVAGGLTVARLRSVERGRAAAIRAEQARVEHLESLRAAATENERVTAPRAGVGEPVTIGGLTVRVVSVELAKARGAGAGDGRESLLIAVELSLRDGEKPLRYSSWRSRPGRPPLARDDLGNEYRTGAAQGGEDPASAPTLHGGGALTDTLVIDPPAESVKYLDLDLPGVGAGPDGTFRFRVPRAAWAKK